ncbi:hypothetical protein ACFFF5_04970 [Lederbergia wuyishanensis]|uniref:Transposase-like protein n=1 Tax=Lederbergia wuyishanensis TaxID=1347903 RepID=A0ABU0CZ72_9BACI|nr:hypothetical protein [Lederbergia wuyishanensis]MCJ8006065.1 hypothetical protein [Lederbergia wuyishanensis]MDQ0341434.1 transposase-like protein [Lederbergia wuyishanensis]
MAKLSVEQKIQVVKRYVNGPEPMNEIASHIGVSKRSSVKGSYLSRKWHRGILI